VNPFRLALSIGVGLAGATFAAVMIVASSGGAAIMPAQAPQAGWQVLWDGPVVRLAAAVAGLCLGIHTLCLWRLLWRFQSALSGSAQRAQAMIDALADGILILDKEHRVVLANRVLAAWLGRPAFVLAGLPAELLAWRSTDNQPLATLPWNAVGHPAGQPIELEAALADGDGNIHPVRVDARPILTGKQAREGTLIVLRPALDPARLPRVGDIALALRHARAADGDLESLLKLSKELVETCQTVLNQRDCPDAVKAPLVIEAT
jgi:PAS domain-containing protein